MFQLIDVSTNLPVNDTVYTSADEALAARSSYPDVKLRLQRFVDDSWKEREASRMEDGTYELLPDYISVYTLFDHFAHVSKTDKAKIAFTASPEKGMENSKTILSASAYLGRFAGDKLLPHKIRDLAAQYESRLSVNDESLVISFERSAFRFAYDGQPVKSESSEHLSCMAREARSYTGSANIHPAEAYATDDQGLAIAYTVDPSHPRSVTARAVLWPKEQSFVRVYGLSEAYRQALTALLKALGYDRSNSLSGAPLARIAVDTGFTSDEDDGVFLMPYIDGNDKCVSDRPDKRRFFICDAYSADYKADSTSGTISVGGDRCTCDNCGDVMDSDDDQYTVNDDQTWCLSCYENEAFICERTNDAYGNDRRSYTVYSRVRTYNSATGFNYGWRTTEETWSRYAVDNYAFRCEHSDCYYDERHFTAIDVNVNTRGGSEVWCEEETKDLHFKCPDCGEYFANDMAHPDSVGTDTLRCVECYEQYVAALEARGEPLPSYVRDANQIEMELVQV